MLQRFLLITLMILIVAFFASPFVIVYLISIGYPEETVDYLYWGGASVVWLIGMIITFIDWKLRDKNE